MNAKEYLKSIKYCENCYNGITYISRIMEEYAEVVVKNCNTPEVSNRRELLLAFVDWFVNVDDSSEMFPTQSSVERFLSKQ